MKNSINKGLKLDKQLGNLQEKLKKLKALESSLTKAGCLHGYVDLRSPNKKKKERQMYIREPVNNGKRKSIFIGTGAEAQALARAKLARWDTREDVRSEIRDIEREFNFLANEISGLVKSAAIINSHLTKVITDFKKQVPAR